MPVTVVVRTATAGSAEAPSLTFDGHRIVIGRSNGCDVRLPDPSVALRHASIRAQGAEFALVDEGSVNGTWVGDTRLGPQTPQIVRTGDLVRVGRVWLELVIDQKPATPDLAAKARELAAALVRNAMTALGDDVIAKVRVTAGRDLGAELSLLEEGRLYLVGRGDSCDLPIDDEDASREHVAFIRRGSQILVRDLESKNGVYLGDARVTPDRDAVWRAPTPIHVGRTILELDDPVSAALTDLEAAPDERLPEGSAPPAPRPPPPVEAAPVIEAPPPSLPAPVSKTPAPARHWTRADLSLVLLAVVVIGISIAGLTWVLR